MEYRFLVPLGAALAVLTGFSTGLGQASVARQAVESVGKNPEATNQIRSTMIVGCAVAETCGIYGLLTAILLIFAF